MKKIRRLCMNPSKDNEPQMHTLYECHGKNGTTSSTVLWFLEEPKRGMQIFGIDRNSHYSPYMNGHAFRYAEFTLFIIDDIYSNDFVVCHRL